MKKANLSVQLGKTKEGIYQTYDIAMMPNLLIGGITGTGKSQLLHSILLQLIENNSPKEVTFIMSDGNRVELIRYNNVPHLYAPVITDRIKGKGLFEWLQYESDRRVNLFGTERVRNIDEYTELHQENLLPKIIVIIDELLFVSDDYKLIEENITFLATITRLTGIHFIMATGSLTPNIITPMIKMAIPNRISFKTNDDMSSKLIIDQAGAEKLDTKGNFLFLTRDSISPIELNMDFLVDIELYNRIKKFEVSTPVYNDVLLYAIRQSKYVISDQELKDAISLAKEKGEIKTSDIQRTFSFGYAKSARIIDAMESEGIISKLDPETKTRKFISK